MVLTNETFAPLRVMIDEFVRGGVAHAVIAPGSRNAPISYALADREELKCWSILDERQAGFFALGLAKSTGGPVVVTCTSGTAAANLHPAVIEADHAGVPLIILSADRPPELRDVGAGQAIDQIKLFGESVRLFVEAGNHPLSEETLRHFRVMGCRALGASAGTDPGPVHINLPLREPLRPIERDLGSLGSERGAVGRAGNAPWIALQGRSAAAGDLHEALALSTRPLIVVGEQYVPELASTIVDLCRRSGAPVLADSLSQMRRRSFADEATIVAGYDLILRTEAVSAALEPDLIVRVGQLPTSKPLRAWLSRQECRQIVFDPRARWQEPTRAASDIWQCDPLATVKEAADGCDRPIADPDWTKTWATLEGVIQEAIEDALGEQPFPFEPAALRTALASLEGASVFVSSSMPIRDVETYGPIGADDVRYLSNRGTNGIDGVVSSALGAKAPFDCDRVVLLTGDLALLYDASALAIASRHEIPLTIVCTDNQGGGIFSFLPIEQHRSHFEEMIAAPPAVDLEAVVRSYGFGYCEPAEPSALVEAIKKPGLVHLRSERTDNKLGHDRVIDRVGTVLAEAWADTLNRS